MEELYQIHIELLNSFQSRFKRELQDLIDWDERLVGLKGSRGVGKTTLLLMHIAEKFGKSTDALFVSMDNLALRGFNITEIAEYHSKKGGSHLFIDEVHKSPDWSLHIKNIYDRFNDLHVVFSGSSLLKIFNSQADLSRRAIAYDLNGLSLREFINIETGNNFNKITLEEIVTDHINIASEISKEIKIFPLFKSYLEYGYYPFYLESRKTYHPKLEQVINTIIESDLPTVIKLDLIQISKIKKLIAYLASEVPFQPNISKLAESLEISRAILYEYIHYLSEAKILMLLQEEGKSYTMLSKPEKIYLHNTNIHACLGKNQSNIGTIREVFFFNQVSAKCNVKSSKTGDFLVNNKYTFEIGGKSKSFKQIANVENSFLAIDDDLSGVKNKIPLWLFGFMY